MGRAILVNRQAPDAPAFAIRPMQDQQLSPIGALRPNRPNTLRCERLAQKIIGDIGRTAPVLDGAKRRPRSRLGLHVRRDIGDAATWKESGTLDDKRLHVDVAPIQTDSAVDCEFVDPTRHSGLQGSTNIAIATRPEFVEPCSRFLFDSQIALPFEAKTVARQHEINVLEGQLMSPEGIELRLGRHNLG